ncbi:MAG: EAL domain-containing protein, partial [Pseudomonadota bacterium]
MFKNRVAKKIFILFILAALLPICIFAFFSTRQIDRVTEENAQIQLQKDSKAYSYALSDRLSSRHTAMMQIASTLTLNHEASQWQLKKTHQIWFTSLSLLKNDFSKINYWGNFPVFDNLSNDKLLFLQTGKTLIQVKIDPLSQIPKIIMIRQVTLTDKQKALLISVLNNEELLGYQDDFDQRTSFCVFNHMKKALFCSESEINNTLTTMISGINLASRGKLTWSDNQTSIYAGYNSLFLEYHYFQKDWAIVFAQAKGKSAFYQKDFNYLFYTIIAITLIFVVYISFLKIRQQMRPLDALMQGISRISSNNFNQLVPVDGNDEFAQLAVAFNQMSQRLSTQFNVLTALAEIDQLILSRLKMHDIIKVVINRANDIIGSDNVGITLLTLEMSSESEEISSKKDSSAAIMYTADPQVNNGISEQSYQINNHTLKDISEKPLIQLDQNETSLHNYVRPLINKGFNYFLIIPIRNQGINIAFISFAYKQAPSISTIEKKWGQEFADRIAVAFANASWEKQLYHQAHYDSLTGLPNRLMFNDHLQYSINNAQRDGSNPVLLFLDLDGFKYINDSLGHLIGDQLLKQIAKRIKICLRKSDTVARLGGDEFVVILSGYHEMASFTLVKTVKKILSEICKPIDLEENALRITGSIGIAIYPQDGSDIQSLLKNADTAMYEAKKQGRAQYQFYSKELNANMLTRLLLDADLHNALENNELQLYYQAKVDTKTGLIIGTEALMRWIYPGKGIINPGVFIPLIEQSGLIIPIGNWLMHEACQQNKKWQDKGLTKIPVSINLSAQQFKHKTLLEDISLALDSSKLEAQYLEMEITESMAMDNFEESVDTVNKIKDLGITFSIDDYGTGYSSLEYIRDFPVDILKIDRAFIINLVQSYREQAIVKSTIIMAHDLGLKVIAEGV